jgi:phosphopantothenoylcysteine decarboxylase/phosphopantothenate--cysteine ligase
MALIIPFQNKRIVLGVTGSIAAFKAATLASLLTKAGAQVDVILTESAEKFVSALTFQALTGRPVYTNLWETDTSGGLPTHIAHVGLSHAADVLVVAPATAQTLTKLALGLSDNLLTITALAARCPIVIAPAMDAGMYEHSAVQAHVEALKGRGAIFVGPVEGRMASGLSGLGRMIEPEEIVGECRRVLGLAGPLAGRRVVISAGPTREALDPVRYLSNYSSGRQGFALAQAALDSGAQVTLIAGPVSLPTPAGAQRIDVETAGQMREAVIEQAARRQADALIMAAAVADFRPAEVAEKKIKKERPHPQPLSTSGEGSKVPSPLQVGGEKSLPASLQGGGESGGTFLHIDLVENPDILFELSQQAGRPRITVGFAAESHDLIEHAQEKLVRKKLDLIVANDITASDAGFGVETNRVVLISAQGLEELPLMGKDEVAARIIHWITERLAE